MATIRQIALKAGVSHMTVSNALNGRAKGLRPDAVERARHIRQLADQMGYRPNAAARSMTDGRTRTVAVAIRDERFGYDALLGMNRVVESAGYALALVPMDDIVRDDEPKSRLFSERMVDALAVLNCSAEDLQRLDERLPDLSGRTVYVDTNRFGRSGCIRRDEVAAGGTAAGELVRLGYRRVLYIDRPDEVVTYCFGERREGAQQACQNAGVDFDRRPVAWFRSGQRDSGLLQRLADELDASTAVLTSDASMARVTQLIWSQRRLVAGLDYALASCDETAEETYLWPQLSRVSFNRMAMGELAGEMLLQTLNGGRSVRSTKVAGQWLPGETARAVKV
ncbi:MAG: LacI family DNA-binding transcriptional regulator [Phycisphaerae bacterium]